MSWSDGKRFVGEWKNGNFWNGEGQDINGNIQANFVNGEIQDVDTETDLVADEDDDELPF